jgi:hypothetical protein
MQGFVSGNAFKPIYSDTAMEVQPPDEEKSEFRFLRNCLGVTSRNLQNLLL